MRVTQRPGSLPPIRTLRRLRTVGLVALLPAAAACPQRTAVWIAPGATRADLTFVLGRERGQEAPVALGSVVVYACADSIGGPAEARAMWYTRVPDRAREVSRVRYGGTLPGFTVPVGARPLTPGCYIAEISGTGVTRFQVRADDGAVEELPAR